MKYKLGQNEDLVLNRSGEETNVIENINSIENTLENGDVNLLHNTNNGISGWDSTIALTMAPYGDSFVSFSFANGVSSSYARFTSDFDAKITEGKKYTLSFEISATENKSAVDLVWSSDIHFSSSTKRLYDNVTKFLSCDTKTESIDSNWKKLSFTATASESTTSEDVLSACIIRFSASSSDTLKTMVIKNIQLEEGEYATSYSPASIDLMQYRDIDSYVSVQSIAAILNNCKNKNVYANAVSNLNLRLNGAYFSPVSLFRTPEPLKVNQQYTSLIKWSIGHLWRQVRIQPNSYSAIGRWSYHDLKDNEKGDNVVVLKSWKNINKFEGNNSFMGCYIALYPEYKPALTYKSDATDQIPQEYVSTESAISANIYNTPNNTLDKYDVAYIYRGKNILLEDDFNTLTEDIKKVYKNAFVNKSDKTDVISWLEYGLLNENHIADYDKAYVNKYDYSDIISESEYNDFKYENSSHQMVEDKNKKSNYTLAYLFIGPTECPRYYADGGTDKLWSQGYIHKLYQNNFDNADKISTYEWNSLSATEKENYTKITDPSDIISQKEYNSLPNSFSLAYSGIEGKYQNDYEEYSNIYVPYIIGEDVYNVLNIFDETFEPNREAISWEYTMYKEYYEPLYLWREGTVIIDGYSYYRVRHYAGEAEYTEGTKAVLHSAYLFEGDVALSKNSLLETGVDVVNNKITLTSSNADVVDGDTPLIDNQGKINTDLIHGDDIVSGYLNDNGAEFIEEHMPDYFVGSNPDTTNGVAVSVNANYNTTNQIWQSSQDGSVRTYYLNGEPKIEILDKTYNVGNNNYNEFSGSIRLYDGNGSKINNILWELGPKTLDWGIVRPIELTFDGDITNNVTSSPDTLQSSGVFAIDSNGATGHLYGANVGDIFWDLDVTEGLGRGKYVIESDGITFTKTYIPITNS